MDAFDVAPDAEAFKCQTFANPFGRDVDIVTSESTMTPGSHHLFAFTVPNGESAPLSDCGGLAFHPSIHSAQVPHLITTYPTGMGRFLSGGDGIQILAHYLNTTQETIHATVNLTLTVADPSSVQIQASYVFMNTLNISVPPLSHGSATGTCTIPTDIHLMSATSHMHQRGVHFDATTPDGTSLYETTEWNEPTPRVFTPPLAIAAGTTVTWTCDYQNTTDTTLTFGQSAVTNEMCIFTGIYYPAPGGVGIECLF